MKNNKTLGIIAIILLAILAVSLYLFSIRTAPVPDIGEKPVIEEEIVKETIYLEATLIEDETGKSLIQISAIPEKDGPHLLSALSIKGVVTSNSGDLSAIEETFVLTPDKGLTDNNWVFIDDTAYSDTKGGVVVELNGYHHSEELYPLEGKVVLATIPLATTPLEQMLTLELDSEFTEFFGVDAIEMFVIKVK